MSPVQPGGGLNREELRGLFSLYSARQLSQALAEGRRLQRIHPEEPLLLNLLGAIHAGLGQLPEAAASYRRAIEIHPGVADSHYHLGNVLVGMGDNPAALAEFERALLIRPDFVEAHGNACRELERANRLPELRDALQRALQHCSSEHPLLRLRQAELLRRERDYSAARGLLSAPFEPGTPADLVEDRAYLLADLCDRLDDARSAFGYAEEANRLCAASYMAQQLDGAAYVRQLEQLAARFTAEWIGSWQPLPETPQPATPQLVFLVGFPRSGTTLLDTILRSHREVAVVEEQPMVARLEETLASFPGGYPDALATLDGAQLQALYDAYFSELARHLEPGQAPKVVVDKLPLNLAHGGLLHRVFPKARFLFAQRHPCDCVLSCYMRPFQLNEGMLQFLDLERSAALYDLGVGLWRQYRELLPLQAHTVVYEELVSDLEATVTPVLAFLGLEWVDEISRYAETARQRGNISTPSYNQVTEPIYTSARGRWERYREPLAPVLPVLAPWAERLGYPAP